MAHFDPAAAAPAGGGAAAGRGWCHQPEIAGRLYLSDGTVKNRIFSILGRLGLRDRIQVALYAQSHGLV